MAAIVKEFAVSRSLGQSELHRKFFIRQATSEFDAGTALTTYVNALTDVGALIVDWSTLKIDEIAELLFVAEITWRTANNPQRQPPNSFHVSFDIGTQTQHLTQAISTTNKYSDCDITIDFKGAIGVDEDGSVQGVDVLMPYPTFQINYSFPASTITDAYIQTLCHTVGKVNTDTFHNFVAGTLLLTKVAGQQREDTAWDLSFGFSVSENLTGLVIGDIVDIDKKGWECLWVYYRTKDIGYSGSGSGTVKICHKTPIQVNIEQIYKTAAFGTNLGI